MKVRNEFKLVDHARMRVVHNDSKLIDYLNSPQRSETKHDSYWQSSQDGVFLQYAIYAKGCLRYTPTPTRRTNTRLFREDAKLTSTE